MGNFDILGDPDHGVYGENLKSTGPSDGFSKTQVSKPLTQRLGMMMDEVCGTALMVRLLV